jgi:putative ABC transport system permease protein
MFSSTTSKTLKISGVLRQRANTGVSILSTGFAYSDGLSQEVINENENSDIVKAQRESNRNIMTMAAFTGDNAKDNFLSYLGGDEKPSLITFYPASFDKKDKLLAYLDAYNEGKPDNKQVIYTDLAQTISNLSGGIMSAITIVLIAFSSISLLVSLIMVSIITYTSVLERTKEIGILKSIGARRKDITRIFNAETFIIGIFSGVLGVSIAFLLTFPINVIIKNMTDLSNVASLNPLHAVALVTISTVLTVLGGYIPARIASRKEAVVALRSE